MLFSFLSLVALAVAYADSEHPAHTHTKRGYPQVPLTPPYRPLVWGDFNVIHTTDTHGWLLGHQDPSWPEPNYSGDLGDFASFVAHMKKIAEDKDVDLLLVDTGDLGFGNGLSDEVLPGEVEGHRSSRFLKELPYDLMTIGNHELEIYTIAYDMYKNFGLKLNGRYLASNVKITIPDSTGTQSVPIGKQYVTFQTKKGRTVTSLGVLFNFNGANKNITVQHVADMVREPWFQQVIAEDTDVFVLVGHMAVSKKDNWPVVFDAIRAVHPYTPILIFGGHSHIRDCQQYDQRSIALESGHYMDTIGWASANLSVAIEETKPISFTRRYLDQNRVTYQYHTATSNATFDTFHGRIITEGLQELAKDYHLAHLYGTAPRDYTTNRDPYPSEGNLVRLFVKEAAPYALSKNNPRTNANIIIINANLLRYDIFKGPFTKNDELSASPYLGSFQYIADVKANVAKQVLNKLNEVKKLSGDEWSRDADLVQHQYHAWLEEMGMHQTMLAMDTTGLTPGYVTMDGCPEAGGPGDDTQHSLPHDYPLPHHVSSDPPNALDDTKIDIVFNDYIKGRVVKALNDLQKEITYTDANVHPYSPTLTNAVLGVYAQDKWNDKTIDGNVAN